MNILFLCTGNSCRSMLAEATFNTLALAGMCAISAGSKPTGQVHPRLIALLRRKVIEAFLGLDFNNLKTPEVLTKQLEKIGLLS